MKVAVITRHAVSNYGSLLQAYAMQKSLEKIGFVCQIIDYIREDERYQNQERTLLGQKPDWNNNWIKKNLYLALRKPESFFSGRYFEKERNKYLSLTQRYSNLSELEQNVPNADVYITGSDQVWGPVSNGSYDSAYCLSFTPENAKRISYAASFGRTSITEDIEKYYIQNLKRYAHVSVREDSAVLLTKKMGILADQVIDPTLLLSAQDWREISSPSRQGQYVLIYQLHNNPELGRYAKQLAKSKGLPLIRISTHLHQLTRPGKFIWNPSMSEFISYIDNASYLVTDSFHGTAFAINLNVPFIEILPNNNTGTRNQSILKLTGLEDRILKDSGDLALADKEIDFESVNEIVDRERIRSLKILKKMIKE